MPSRSQACMRGRAAVSPGSKGAARRGAGGGVVPGASRRNSCSGRPWRTIRSAPRSRRASRSSRRQSSMKLVRGTLAWRPSSRASSRTNTGTTRSAPRAAAVSEGWSWTRRSRRNQTIAVVGMPTGTSGRAPATTRRRISVVAPVRDFPLFPLGLVALPSELIPLHIFEERYKTMIGRCLEEESEFGIVWLADEAYADLVREATDRTPDAEELAEMTAYEMAATVEFGLDAKQGLLDLRSETARLKLVTRLFRAAIKRLEFVERAEARARSNGRVHFEA